MSSDNHRNRFVQDGFAPSEDATKFQHELSPTLHTAYGNETYDESGKESNFKEGVFTQSKDLLCEESGERDIKYPTTNVETLIHLLKGNIGTGSLAMPEAFMHAGLWVGFAGIPVLGAVCIHCMHVILQCSRELCQRGNIPSMSYEETAEMAFKLGPPWARKWDKVVAKIITTFLIITQIGFCCVYIVFFTQNFYQAMTCMTGNTSLSQYDYMLIMVVPLLLLAYIPNLKYLAPVSMVASVFQTVGTILTFYYLVRDLPHVEMAVPAFGGWDGLPLYFGTALFAFEGIGLVLPLENKMKTPHHFPGATGVLNIGMILVTILYCALGFFGYLRYGDYSLGSITLNLPGDEVLAQSIKFILGLAIFLSYPLQLYVPLEILLPSVVRRFTSKFGKVAAEYVFRSLLVFFTFALAAAIPNIGLFINLVGAVSSTTLALIFPPIIDIVTFWSKNGINTFRFYKNVFIVLFGLVGFGTGAYASIKAIVEFFALESQSIALGC